jgi:uncharacterized membrane protein
MNKAKDEGPKSEPSKTPARSLFQLPPKNSAMEDKSTRRFKAKNNHGGRKGVAFAPGAWNPGAPIPVFGGGGGGGVPICILVFLFLF